MHKKTHLSLKINENSKPVVSKGAKIKSGDPLIKPKKAEIFEFDLSKLLKVKPKTALSYLIVSEGDHVEQGQVIAKKQEILSKQLVKSPQDGKFVIVDPEKALVGIEKGQTGQDLLAWFDGTIEDVTDKHILFSVSGVVVTAKDGKGSPVSGKLNFISEKVTAFTMPVDLENSVLAIREAASDVIAKADALGVVAMVVEKLEQPPFSLPYLIVSDIEDLKHHHHKMVVVNGDEKQMLVIE